MTEPKLLSPEELERVMSGLPLNSMLRAHIAALEKERDECEARHRAEMREMMDQVGEATRTAEAMMAERNSTQADLDAALADNAARTRIGAQMANACFNLVQRKEMTTEDVITLDRLRQEWDALGPHPGAALLEELTSLRSHVATLTKDTADLMSSKALVRARNEGLRKAELHIMSRPTWVAHDMRGLLAAEIDAMKEPEPCCERDMDGDGNCDRHKGAKR